MSLAGKRALITGSTRGLGLAIATALADAGADVLLNSRDLEALGEATTKLTQSGVRVRAAAFDVTNSDSIGDAVRYIERELGPIDVLVNAAGMRNAGPLADFREDHFERLMLANVQSVFLVSQAVARRMIPRGTGRIITICSAADAPYNAADAASRAAVASLTRSLAAEWGPHGLCVNGLAPGADQNDGLGTDFPTELGAAAIFLASDASRSLNGRILPVAAP